MKILSQKRCIIGEGPIWNDREEKLYYTDALGKEICSYDLNTQEIRVRALPFNVSAFVFDGKNNLIVSHANGVHILCEDNSLLPIYDNFHYLIQYANDMKAGPDGSIYVGTQSGKRKGVSDNIDGKLYRISKDGDVVVLLNGLALSNGMDWSMDEKKFYHADTDNRLIKEYDFDKATGNIFFTGRQVELDGVDGFTIGEDDRLYVGCWERGYVAVVNTKAMQIEEYINVPCKIPVSCGFCGRNMEFLAVTSASRDMDLNHDVNAGFTFLLQNGIRGRKPFLFGKRNANE